MSIIFVRFAIFELYKSVILNEHFILILKIEVFIKNLCGIKAKFLARNFTFICTSLVGARPLFNLVSQYFYGSVFNPELEEKAMNNESIISSSLSLSLLLLLSTSIFLSIYLSLSHSLSLPLSIFPALSLYLSLSLYISVSLVFFAPSLHLYLAHMNFL